MMKTFVRSDGVRLRYLDHGQGMAIVLMPGAGGTHDVYDRQVDVLLEAGCRVILLDREGRGQCDWGKYRFTNVGQARDAWAILDTIGINKAVLVGRSSGAFAIQQMYLAQPNRVIALVSIDSDSFGKFSPRDFRSGCEPGAEVNGDGLDAGLDSRFDSQTIQDYHRNKASLATINVLWEYPSDYNTKMRLAWFEQLKNLNKDLDLRPENPAEVNAEKKPLGDKWCNVPLLVFAAGRGRVGPGDPESNALARRLPSAQAILVTVKNSGHWVNVEAADQFNRELLNFLGSLKELS